MDNAPRFESAVEDGPPNSQYCEKLVVPKNSSIAMSAIRFIMYVVLNNGLI